MAAQAEIAPDKFVPLFNSLYNALPEGWDTAWREGDEYRGRPIAALHRGSVVLNVYMGVALGKNGSITRRTFFYSEVAHPTVVTAAVPTQAIAATTAGRVECWSSAWGNECDPHNFLMGDAPATYASTPEEVAEFLPVMLAALHDMKR